MGIRQGLPSWLQSVAKPLDVAKHFTLWLQPLTSAIGLNRARNGPRESYPAAVSLRALISMLSYTDPLSWWQAWTLNLHHPVSVFGNMGMMPNDKLCSTVTWLQCRQLVFSHFIKTTKTQIAASLYHHLLATSSYCHRYCNYYNLS